MKKRSHCQVELDLTILNLPGIPDAECELKALKKCHAIQRSTSAYILKNCACRKLTDGVY